MAEPEEPQGEERSEVEREREEPARDEDVQPVKDESDPWAKFSTGRDPDE